jgi:hypothetical protein
MNGDGASDERRVGRTILLAAALAVAGFGFAAAPASGSPALDGDTNSAQISADTLSCEGCPCPLEGKLGQCPQAVAVEEAAIGESLAASSAADGTECIGLECRLDCVGRVVENPKDPTCRA